MKNIIINIFIVLITIILTLYLIELVLRSTAQASPFNGKCDREYIESLQNLENYGERNFNKDFKEPLFIDTCPYPRNTLRDAYQVTWGHVVKNNSDYFRWREFKKPSEREISVMILGDSMTWGVGMPLQNSYPFLVEEILNNEEGLEFIIYSLALPGGSTDQHLANLKQYFKVVDPDIIVLALYHNDIESAKKNIEIPTFTEETLIYFLNVLKVMKLVKISELLENVFSKLITRDWQDYRDEAFFNKNSWHWKNLSNNLKEIKEISDNKNLPGPILMSVNGGFGKNTIDLTNPPKDYKRWTGWHTEFENEGCRQGYYVFNQMDQMIKLHNNKFLAINEWDYHPSEDMHRLYANNLKIHILNLLKIEKKKKYC